MCVEIETYTTCYMHEMCVLRKFSEKILSTKMCVEIETYTICFMHEMCVFRKFSEKNFYIPKCVLKFS